MNTTIVWLGISGIVIAVLSVMYAAYYWERKQQLAVAIGAARFSALTAKIQGAQCV